MPSPFSFLQTPFRLRGRAALVWFCVATGAQAQTSHPTTGPATSQPAPPRYVTMSCDELLKEVALRPLMKVEWKTSSGHPLTDEDKAKMQQADGHMAASLAARKKGDFRGAADSARQAIDAYQRLFGASHFLTIAAMTESATMDQFARFSPAEQQDLVSADRLEESAETATKQGNFFAARKAARESLDIRERILGKSHSELGDVLRILGNAEIELQSLNSAQEKLTRALDVTETAYGKSHPKTAVALDRLGWLRIYQGQFEPATTVLRRAVWILTNAQGETAETAESLDNLGMALAYVGEFEEAMNLKLRALFIRETLLGPSARETGVSLSNMAWLCSRIGKFNEVIPLRNRALAIFEKELGAAHHDTIIELSNLAQAYFSAGKFQEASDLYEKQIARDDQSAAPMDAGAVNRLMMLGSVKLRAGRREDAERAFARAFEKAKRLYDGGERSAAINELTQLATIYDNYRMLDDAAMIREQIWKWDEAQATIATADTIQRNVQTARAFLAVGRAQEAATILTKAVSQSTVLFGKGEMETVGPMVALSTAQERLDELDPAVKLCDQALRIIEAREGRESPFAISVMYQLGHLQTLQKKYDVAKFSLEEGLKYLQEAPRRQPVMENSFLRELAVCEAGLGQKDEATKSFDQVIDQSRELAKNGNPHRLSDFATSIRRYLDASQLGLSIDAPKREALTAELRGALEKLRAAKALTAENKKWLEELSSGAHP